MKNGVIVYMSREEDCGLLYSSILLLYKNFNSKYRYPIVVFHDNITKMTVSKILVSLYNELGFVPKIQWEFLRFEHPDHVSTDEKMYDPPLSRFWMGYRHMCRFQSGEIYKHPALMNYDWYWRLDSDSFILSEINYDVFEYMDKNEYEYAFLKEYRKDCGFVTVNLWETTKKFMRENSITPLSLNDKLKNGDWECDIFYTNFEIAKFSFFRGSEYTSYYNYLDSTGMIYYNRWGDAPIHWLGVHMFLPDSKIWRVEDISYLHKDWARNTKYMNESSLRFVPEPFKSVAISTAKEGL